MAPSVPPLTEMSLSVKPTGASLKLKLTVAVIPPPSKAGDALSRVMVTVGAAVSMAIAGVAPAPPSLPAASVY